MLFGRPPDPKVMEVYNDFNSNLTNLYACVKNHTMEFLRQLGFLPLNGRDEFLVSLRRFLEGQEFNGTFLAQELELAMHNLPPLEFEELRSSFWNAQRRGCPEGGCILQSNPVQLWKRLYIFWLASPLM